MKLGKACLIFGEVAMIFVMNACGHSHEWVDATCTAPKTCSICEKTEGEAKGHVWVEATCAKPKTCTVCGDTEGNPLNHTWIEATCTEPKRCSVCGKEEGTELGHKVNEWELVKEATCSEEGIRAGMCIRCNSLIHEEIPTEEHTLGEWVVTKEATLSSQGERTQSCTVCGSVINEESFSLTAEEIKELYKQSCTEYDYKTIARDPDKYMNTYGKYTGEIIQVIEDGSNLQLRVNITKQRGNWYSDTIYVTYTRKSGESRLLEDDIVTIYGVNAGTVSYESILGATITLPYVAAEYIDLIE